MTSSSLLQLDHKSLIHNNDHFQNQFTMTPCNHQYFYDHNLNDSLPHSNQSKTHQLFFPLPLPNFLIDPQDGQFTPYFDRSPVSSPEQEYDDPIEFNQNSQTSSPIIPISPLRSRATSVALKKLIETQAQRLLDISAAWKKKYPGDDLEFSLDTLLDKKPPSSSFSIEIDHDEQQNEEADKSCASGLGLILSTPKKYQPNSRFHRSISQKSPASLSSLIERLSLNDADVKNRDALHRVPLKADVENWKREVLESKLRLQMTRDWVNLLPPAEDFEKITDNDVDLTA